MLASYTQLPDHRFTYLQRGLVTAILIGTNLVPLNVSAQFADVDNNNKNTEAIEYVRNQGIVEGYSDKTFRPENKINRAELVKILVKSFLHKEDVSGSDCFSDVRSEWFAPYICTAAKAGIVAGYPDATFQPSKPVNFVEAAKMIGIALSLKIEKDAQPWYKPFVSALEMKSAIPISIQSFSQNISRGEMAEIIFRLSTAVDDKPTRTFAELAGVETKTAQQTSSEDGCSSSGKGEICSKSLFSLPHTLETYRTDGLDSLELLTDSDNKHSVFYIKNRFRDTELFIDGKYKGKYDRFAASVSEDGSAPLVVFGSGDHLFLSNQWGQIKISPIVQNMISESIQRRIFPTFPVNSIEEAVIKQGEREREMSKQLKEYLNWSDAQVEASVTGAIERVYPKELKHLASQLKLNSLSLGDVFLLLHYKKTGERPFNGIFISFVWKQNDHRSVIFLSLTDANEAWALDIVDGELVGLYPAFAPWGNSQPVAYDAQSNTLAFPGINPEITDSVGSSTLEGKAMWINGALEKTFNSNISFPRLSNQGELLYIGTNIKEKGEEYNFDCTAIIGKTSRPFACNDPLFARFITYTTAFRFPRVSPDGKTVVYPELVDPSEAKDDWLYPEKAFTSRLIVNGKPQDAHPWVDFPYFTKKGLAVVTHSDNSEAYVDSYVEWDGKKVGPFQSLLPNLASTTDFRGYPPMFQSIHGSVGDEDLPDAVIVSPDGESIAFSGYNTKSGWTLYKNMERIASYDHISMLTFSPDSEKLGYLGTSIDRSKSEPGVQIGEYRLVEQPFERVALSQVIVNGLTLSSHEKVLWMQFAPNTSDLLYIAKDNGRYRLLRNGIRIGSEFDALVEAPTFSSEGTLKFGVVDGLNVKIVTFSSL